MKEKKQLFKVKLLASEEFGNKEITETLCSEYSYLINRRFYLNLSELLDTNRYQYKIWFRIFKIENGIAYSRFDGVETLREHIYNAIYPGVKTIRIYTNVTTKDGCLLRVKYILTFRKLNSKKESSIRKIVEENTKKILSEMTIKDIINNLILKNTVIKKIEKEVKKINIPLFLEIIKIERKDKIPS
ncbi:MAG: hypothetical protein QXP52_00965 [Candidatus Aenigmatarchaeota archaeon]